MKKRPLTGRQSQILALLVRGLERKQIAHILGMRQTTVSDYLWDARHRLRCHTTAELVAKWRCAVCQGGAGVPVEFSEVDYA